MTRRAEKLGYLNENWYTCSLDPSTKLNENIQIVLCHLIIKITAIVPYHNTNMMNINEMSSSD